MGLACCSCILQCFRSFDQRGRQPFQRCMQQDSYTQQRTGSLMKLLATTFSVSIYCCCCLKLRIFLLFSSGGRRGLGSWLGGTLPASACFTQRHSQHPRHLLENLWVRNRLPRLVLLNYIRFLVNLLQHHKAVTKSMCLTSTVARCKWHNQVLL